MWVTGSPVSPNSFIALMPNMDARLDVTDECLVDIGQGHAGIVQREQSGIAGQMSTRDVAVHAEADHADPGHGDAFEAQAPPHDPDPVVSVRGAAGRKR